MNDEFIRHMVDNAKRLAGGTEPLDNPWVIRHSGKIVERCTDQIAAMQRLVKIQPHSIWEATRKDGWEIVNEANGVEHELVVDSGHDGMAHCKCGKWEYTITGEIDKDRMNREFDRHVAGKPKLYRSQVLGRDVTIPDNESTVRGVLSLLKSIKEKKIEKFWVVTEPSPESTIDDIMFEVDHYDFATTIKGGLDPNDIHGLYEEEAEARNEAEMLMKELGEGKIPDDADPEDTKIKKLTEANPDEDRVDDVGKKEKGPEIDRVKDPANPTPAEGEEEEQDTVTKEYIGKTEDTHFYMVGTPSQDEEVPEDLQIVDQEGMQKFSAKEKDIDPADPAEFIIQAIQELEIDEITRSVLIKYILPQLEEDEEEDEGEDKPEGMEEQPEGEEKSLESKKVDEGERYTATPEEGGKYWREQLIAHLEKIGDKATPEEKELLAKAKAGKTIEAKVPDDADPEDTKIKKLIETTVKMGDDEFDVDLVDDGTVDTVISINGHEYRFDQEFASMWRDEATGELSDDGLQELALDALSNMEEDEYAEVVAAGDTRSEDQIESEEAEKVRSKKLDTQDSDREDRRRERSMADESKVNEDEDGDKPKVTSVFVYKDTESGDWMVGEESFKLKGPFKSSKAAETIGRKEAELLDAEYDGIKESKKVDEKKKLPDALKKNMFKKGKRDKCKESKVNELDGSGNQDVRIKEAFDKLVKGGMSTSDALAKVAKDFKVEWDIVCKLVGLPNDGVEESKKIVGPKGMREMDLLKDLLGL